MGHPTLRRPARRLMPNEIGSEDLRRLVADMCDTLHDYAGIGLAAPQIDEPIRLAIIEIEGGESRYGELANLPLTVFVNPEIEVMNPSCVGFWEGCLSVPGLRGFVERPQHVRITYQDLDGGSCQLELKGFFATVAQHEFDHLDGRLYIDHIDDWSLLMFEEEFQRYHLAPD
jgi:peptide deformylase